MAQYYLFLKCWEGGYQIKRSVKSGFYSNINPGYQMMADRGFLIGDHLARLGATLVMPPFLKGSIAYSCGASY